MKQIVKSLYNLYAYLLMVLLLLICFPFLLFFSLYGTMKGWGAMYFILHTVVKIWYFMTGIRYSGTYEHEDNPGQQYIYVANHSSYMDIPTMIRAVQKPIRVLGKAQVSKIPIFGYFYNKMVIAVDRNDFVDRVRGSLAVKRMIEQGISVFIFPEGTFNETVQPMKTFYDGAFYTAINTQTPVKPMVFLDNSTRMPPDRLFSLTPGICRVIYLGSISVKGLDRNDVGFLKQKVFDAMASAIFQEKNKLI